MLRMVCLSPQPRASAPGRFVRQRFVRPVYSRCDQPHAAPLSAPVPPSIIEGTLSGVQLMADLVIGAERSATACAQHSPKGSRGGGFASVAATRLVRAAGCWRRLSRPRARGLGCLCALGKKNYLFIGDVGPGQRSAVFYSLLGSCLRSGAPADRRCRAGRRV